MRFLILCAMFSFQALAATDTASWNKLLADAGAKGATLAMQDGTEFHYFQQLTPNDLTVSHTADYYSVHGVAGTAGDFIPSDVDEIFENWTLNADKSWSVSQYLFEMDPQGNVTRIYYSTFKEKDSAVSDADQKNVDPADPAAMTILQNKLAGWYAFDKNLK